MSTHCLLGRRHPDGRTVTVVDLAAGGPPDQLLPLLRQLHAWTSDSETQPMTDRLLAHGWAHLSPDTPASPVAERLFAGILTRTDLGLTFPDPAPPRTVRLEQPLQAGPAQWLYTFDGRDGAVTVYEATVHGRWARHSHHPLRLHRPEPLPPQIAGAGDAATGHQTHLWRPGFVSMDGWSGAWDAQLCTVEYEPGRHRRPARRRHPGRVIADTASWFADRGPGSALPALRLSRGRLTVTWFAGTGHRQHTVIRPDGDGRYILGQHILPWIAAGDVVPGHDPRHLRNGTAPILEWATEAGLHASHPILAGQPLPVLAATLRSMAGGTAVLAPADGITAHHGWLLTSSHALLITPTPPRPGYRHRHPAAAAGRHLDRRPARTRLYRRPAGRRDPPPAHPAVTPHRPAYPSNRSSSHHGHP